MRENKYNDYVRDNARTFLDFKRVKISSNGEALLIFEGKDKDGNELYVEIKTYEFRNGVIDSEEDYTIKDLGLLNGSYAPAELMIRPRGSRSYTLVYDWV